MKVCILLNGEIKDYSIVSNFINNENYDCIICADGGADHVYKMNITPNYIIGDLDSIDNNIIDYYKKQNVLFEEFPSKKNETDSELCILLAKKLGAQNIDLFATLGGRIDHTLANINLLYYIKEEKMIPRIISEKEEIYIATNESIQIKGMKDDLISIIPIKGDAKGVTLENLEYPLNDYNMKYSTPLGISNIMLGDVCSINIREGSVLIIRNKIN